MRLPTRFALLLGATVGVAQAATIEERIDQGVNATETSPGEDFNLGRALGTDDASLDPSMGGARLPTTLQPIDIEQRIDKGLTAAGETSNFGPDYAFGAFQRGWFLTAFSLALERAEKGDAPAQTLLGELLSRGLGVKQDLKAAADWYGLAANGGDREAHYALGQLYLEGQGIEADPVKAAEHFRLAADLDHAGAARELGYLLLNGKGIENNAMLAAAYLRRAAALGDIDAQFTLAGLFVEGVGVVADEAMAARWFGEAAKNGHVGAEVEYAILLFNGRGVAKDEAAAAGWFLRAANADNPVAQLRLARLYFEGLGVDADPAEAARWYLIAKANGLEDDAMDERLTRLDSEVLGAARAAAERWVRVSRGELRAAARPDPAEPAVDKQVQ
jgi:TPR repeat protein